MVKTHREFSYIYKKGKSYHTNSVVLFFLPHNTQRNVGFTATKKVGNAVKRNRAKRRMRAMFLEYSHSLRNGTYIFVAKTGLFETSYEKLHNDFKKILSRAQAITA